MSTIFLKKLSYITLLFGLFLLAACGEKPIGTSEGTITYKVTYPKMAKDNFMLDFMPTKMTLKFKDNIYKTSLSAGMGMFKTNFICDKDDDKFVQTVKLINKKYALELEGDDIFKSLAHHAAYHIEFLNEPKKILGYTCNKAIITIDNKTNDAFTVYYTDQINIDDPNWCNQFSPIKGVMLEYQYEKYNMCMRFTATKIKFERIKDEEFDIPHGYEKVDEKRMDKEMTDIFNSFN